MGNEKFEEVVKNFIKKRSKITIITRSLAFLDNGKFDKKIFKKFDLATKKNKLLKGML